MDEFKIVDGLCKTNDLAYRGLQCHLGRVTITWKSLISSLIVSTSGSPCMMQRLETKFLLNYARHFSRCFSCVI